MDEIVIRRAAVTEAALLSELRLEVLRAHLIADSQKTSAPQCAYNKEL